MKATSIRNILLGLTLVVLSFGVGVNYGRNSDTSFIPSGRPKVVNTTPPPSKNVDFSLFWDVWRRLEESYIDKKAIDQSKMVYGAISGMVSALGDPYTVFLPPSQNKESKDSLGGHFEGIGAQLGVKDKKIIVVAPLKGTPAEKAGLRASDWIVKVDGKDTADWTLPETVSAIRGQKGTKVVLTILRKDEEKTRDVSVVRDTINVPSVEWEMKDSGRGKVVYLKLSQFGDKSNNEWDKAVEEIEARLKNDNNREIKGLVLDLRNNPGGYLSGAVYIASEFVENGNIVTQESTGEVKKNFNVNRTGKLIDIPVVVLVNKGSASASEIVAGALRDRIGAKLVGETTFGKGSIQDVQELPAGAGLHITIAKWLLPSGKWVNGSGIKPDLVVENEEATASAQTPEAESDEQLDKAIEMLTK